MRGPAMARVTPAHAAHQDPQSQIRHLQTLVRVGLPRIGTAQELKKETDALIDALNGARERLTPHQRLRVAALSAEQRFNLGSPEQAAAELEPLMAPMLDRLERRGGRGRFFDDKVPAEERRQVIWAIMGVAFYGHYVNNRIPDAQRVLERAQDLIKEELAGLQPDRRPSGTLCRLHYFLGHCSRAVRRFDDAEAHFLESQRHADERLQRELDEPPPPTDAPDADRRRYYFRRNEQIAFSVICAGRILSGLGWVAMQQGRLQRAQHLYYAARTLMRPTGQSGMQLFVDVMLLTARRRAARPGSPEWQASVEGLEGCLKQYDSMRDRRGSRRALIELGRAWIDHAATGVAVEQSLANAAGFRRGLDQLAPEGRAGNVERFHARLLEAHEHLLREDYGKARASCAAAAELGGPVGSHDPIDDTGGLRILQGTLETAEKNFTAAAGTFLDILDKVRGHDPVLEAECHLKMAMLAAQCGDFPRAHAERLEWERLSRKVDNAYLRTLRDQVLALIAKEWERPVVLNTHDLGTAMEQLEALTYEIYEIALARTESQAAAAKLLKVSDATMSRYVTGRRAGRRRDGPTSAKK